jgi:hypothetical protein
MDYLEDEYKEPYAAWKAAPSPAANAQMLQTLQPTIEKGIRAHVGEPNPLLTSRARKLALEGLRSYDPSRARLQTHLFNQFQGLKRIARQQNQVIKAPERVIFDQQQLRQYEQELTDEMGREPTDGELANHSGFSLKRIAHVRGYQPGVSSGMMEGLAPGFAGGIRPDPRAQQMWTELVYDDLAPLDQKILEYTLGMHGRKPLSNMEIARKLGRSPGAISQRKARVQKLLDQEQELSPFLG